MRRVYKFLFLLSLSVLFLSITPQLSPTDIRDADHRGSMSSRLGAAAGDANIINAHAIRNDRYVLRIVYLPGCPEIIDFNRARGSSCPMLRLNKSCVADSIRRSIWMLWPITKRRRFLPAFGTPADILR